MDSMGLKEETSNQQPSYAFDIFLSYSRKDKDFADEADIQTLATGGTDGTVRLWNRDDYQRLLDLPGQVSEIQTLAFSPNNETLLAGGRDGIQLWYAPRVSDKSPSFVHKSHQAK